VNGQDAPCIDVISGRIFLWDVRSCTWVLQHDPPVWLRIIRDAICDHDKISVWKPHD
jgi:hypothetical protein